MAFLGNLFKKKPGGTLVGNLIRGVASSYTGGLLGSGANRIEVGQTMTNKQLAQQQAAVQGVTPPPTVASQLVATAAQGVLASDPGKQAIASTGVALGKKYWWVLLFPGIGLVYWLATRNRNKRPRRR